MGIILWRALVLIFLLLALIGILLPGLPTTVFLILAAWAASKGWPKMDTWLLNHPKYGESLRLWRAEGSVPRKAKYMASAMMLLSALIILFTAVPWWLKLLIYAILLLVLMWLWCRPEPSSTKQS
jgi:uncharacterized membrane protein YbaN (DUF454 family)